MKMSLERSTIAASVTVSLMQNTDAIVVQNAALGPIGIVSSTMMTLKLSHASGLLKKYKIPVTVTSSSILLLRLSTRSIANTLLASFQNALI